MKHLMALGVAAVALAGAQAVTATSADAGRWCGGYHVYHYSAPCCCCRPYFGYHKTTQYWPAYRAMQRLPYYRLETYRMVRPRR
jgi:hypothetical protein